MPDISAGSISLDLVISSQIQKQLDSIRSAAEKPAERLGQSIENAIAKPVQETGKKLESTLGEASSKAGEALSKSFEGARKEIEQSSDGIDEAIERFRQRQAEMTDFSIPENAAPVQLSENVKQVTGSAQSEPETEETKKSAEELNEQLIECHNSFEVMSEPVERLNQKLTNTAERIELLQKKWLELNNLDVDENTADKTYSQLNSVERQIIQAQESYEKLQEKIEDITRSEVNDNISDTESQFAEKIKQPLNELTDEMREKLGNFEVSDKPAKRLEQQLENTKDKISILQKKWQELQAEKNSYSQEEIGGEEWNKTISAINAVEKQIISLQTSADKTETKLSKMAVNPAELIKAKLKSAASAAGNALKKTLGGAFNGLKSVGSKALDAIGSKVSGLKNKFKILSNPVAKLGKSIKSAFKSAFLMAGLYAGFRALKDGLGEAAKADEQFSKSLNEVRANLSIAFTPIIQSVMPVLNTLMSGLASVTKSVAGFISGLFGTTYKQSAEAAKKLKSVSSEAKKAKLSMAGIDEMNVLSDSDSGNSDSDNEDIDYSKIDMSEPELPDWAERLKESIKNGDWAGVGAILAERVNSVFSLINWDSIQKKVNGAIKGITDGINGFLNAIDWNVMGDTLAGGVNTVFGAIYTFFSGIDWNSLGSGIAKGLNRVIRKINWKQIGKAFASQIQALIDTIYAFVTQFDWAEFGKSVGDSVNAWFEGIDFGKAGAALSRGIKGLLDTAIKFIQTVDWNQVRQKIAAFLSNIDWTGIASKAFELLGSALGASVSLLWGAVREVVYSIRDYFSGKIEECGGNIIAGLWNGIKEAFKNATKWVNDNIFKPFIDSFKKCFGIHSPSTVMAEMGGYIIQGLCNAVSGGVKKVKEVFEDVLKAIKGVFEKIGDWFGEKFSEAWDCIKNAFSSVKTWFQSRWDDIKSVFSTAASWFGEKFRSAWENIRSAFSGIKVWFQNRWNDIKNVFGDVGSWFSEKFQAAYDGITGIFSELGDFFSGVWDDISEGAKTGINWIIDKINGLLDKVESAVNFIIDGLNSISFEIPDWAPGGGKSFGLSFDTIDIPEVPHLAAGGLATAPTLAMVGDNRNARTDPEVIAPLSKLKGFAGDL